MATMATVGLRQIVRASQVVSSRGISVSAVVNKKDWRFNDPFEHATGVEKWELTKKKEGNDDPFFMNARPRGKGTKEDPNVVDAMATYRLVGCSCNDEDTNLKWMWVFEGKPKRCACGYWFELKVHEGPDKYKLPA